MLDPLTTAARVSPAPAQALYFPDFLAAFGVSSMIEYTFVL
jgi:hypothetical protein